MSKLGTESIGVVALIAGLAYVGWRAYGALRGAADSVGGALDNSASGIEQVVGGAATAVGDAYCQLNPTADGCGSKVPGPHALFDEECFPIKWDDTKQAFVRTGPRDPDCMR